MKKKLLFSLIILLFASTMRAGKKERSEDNLAVHKGNFTISVGYGAPSLLRAYLKLKTTRDKYSIAGQGPYMAKADYFISNHWSIGLNASYSMTKISWLDFGYDPAIKDNRDYEYGIRGYDWSFLVRGNYHFKVNQKLDMYAGLGLGYGIDYLQTYTLAPLNQFAVRYDFPLPYNIEATAGTRYYLTKNVGLYAEVGLGKAWILLEKYFLVDALLQIGLNVKF